MTTFFYPSRYPVEGGTGNTEDPRTLAVDYLYMHRHRLMNEGKKDSARDNYFFSRRNYDKGPKKVIYDDDAIYIAMPGNIQTSYGPAYRRMDIGGIGVALTEMLGDKDMSSVANTLQDAAEAALPEFSTATAVQMANSFNQYLGLSGATDINAIQQMNHGKIFNPFSEQVFAGVSFRTHNFAFKMLATDDKEAEHIYNIIEYIKEGAMPGMSGGDFNERLVNKNSKYKKMNPKQNKKGKEIDYKHLDVKRKNDNVFKKDIFKKMSKNGYATSDRYMTIPDRFDLRFVRMNANSRRGRDAPMNGSPDNVAKDRKDVHFKMFPSICTGVQVNYTPDSTYMARKQINSDEIDVPAVVLSCSFVETRLLTKEDVRRGY